MMGVDPKVWGPSGWRLLHRMSFCIGNVSDAKEFFMALQHILPCPKCRINLIGHMTAIPFPKRKAEIPFWLYRIHIRVNESLGDLEPPPSFDSVKRMYQSAPMLQDEWVFMRAIAETHPGARQVTSDYIESLRQFVKIWSKCSQAKYEEQILPSKTLFKAWVSSQKQKRIPKIRSCDRTLCSLTS